MVQNLLLIFMVLLCILLIISILKKPFESLKNPCKFKILQPKYSVDGNIKKAWFNIIVEKKHRVGFYVTNWKTKEREVFAHIDYETKEKVGKYGVDISALEKIGVRLIGAYALLGRYDMIFIYEAPDEKVAMSLALTSSTGSYLPSETWTAVPMKDFVKLATSLRR